jgi:hypothetical protein
MNARSFVSIISGSTPTSTMPTKFRCQPGASADTSPDQCGRSRNGVLRYGSGSFGSPSTRSPIILR